MLVLAIETSCDETAVALMHSEQGLLAQKIYSQIPMHAEFGGVVPELASRDHCKKLLPLLQALLSEQKLTPQDLDAVAYTAGPGLAGALMVGASFGRSLAWALGIPALAVHHMEGHLMSPMLADTSPEYPFIALLVSGGHTQLMAVKAFGDYELLGETLDDSVGEAFDKTAKILGLPYPGGPELAKLAQTGNSEQYLFPQLLKHRKDLSFSFSGLKTHVRNLWQTEQHNENQQQLKADIAAGFQKAAIDFLVKRSRQALNSTGYKNLVVAGGVSANLYLRESLKKEADAGNLSVYFPPMPYCTDNAAMIAYAALRRLKRGEQNQDTRINIHPRWPLSTFCPI